MITEEHKEGAWRSPILFLHGSYHAAWCWEENFMPYFAEKGHKCYALSFRGQGSSDIPEGATVAGTLRSFTDDVASIVSSLESPPSLVAHSFAGLIAQRYLADGRENPPIKCCSLVASVPPDGNRRLVMRFLRTMPVFAIKLTYAFITKAFVNNEQLCKETFFSKDMDDELVRRYMRLLDSSSSLRLLDLQHLQTNELPITPPAEKPPLLVMGSSKDKVVDAEGVFETATAYNVDPLILDDVAHDMMLDVRWQRAAEALAQFHDSVGA